MDWGGWGQKQLRRNLGPRGHCGDAKGGLLPGGGRARGAVSMFAAKIRLLFGFVGIHPPTFFPSEKNRGLSGSRFGSGISPAKRRHRDGVLNRGDQWIGKQIERGNRANLGAWRES